MSHEWFVYVSFLGSWRSWDSVCCQPWRLGTWVGWPSWPSDWKQIYQIWCFCVFWNISRWNQKTTGMRKLMLYESQSNVFWLFGNLPLFATKLSLFPFGNIARLLKEVGSSNHGVLMHQSKDYKPAYRGQVELGRLWLWVPWCRLCCRLCWIFGYSVDIKRGCWSSGRE